MAQVKYLNVSLVIQGPINDTSKLDFMEAIPYYKTLFSEIIISTYTEHLVGNVEFIDFCENNNIILRHQSTNLNNLRNDNNIGFQSVTTFYGLRSVTNPYVMKHRTDERFSNLDKIVDRFLQDDNKWVCNSTLFGPKVYYPFHAADHLFIGKTDKLLRTFEITLIDLQNKTMEEVVSNGVTEKSNVGRNGAPEITFTKNFIRVSGEEPDLTRHDEQMLKYFDIINNSELMPVLVRQNGANKVMKTLEDMGPNRLQYQTMNDILTKDYLPDHHLWD
jgi:hypothetical protein